jgi:hypothetical protein
MSLSFFLSFLRMIKKEATRLFTSAMNRRRAGGRFGAEGKSRLSGFFGVRDAEQEDASRLPFLVESDQTLKSESDALRKGVWARR